MNSDSLSVTESCRAIPPQATALCRHRQTGRGVSARGWVLRQIASGKTVLRKLSKDKKHSPGLVLFWGELI